MEIDSDNLAQISLIRLPEDPGEGLRGPQGVAAGATGICALRGTVGRYGMSRIGSSSTVGGFLGGAKTPRR